MPRLSIFPVIAFVAGGLLVFLGLMFLIAASYAPTRIFPGIILMGMGALAIYVGTSGKRKEMRIEEIQDDIIRLARKRGGKLTLAEVVSDLGLPVDLARKALLSLEKRGIAYLDFEKIEDEGVEVYKFPGV